MFHARDSASYMNYSHNCTHSQPPPSSSFHSKRRNPLNNSIRYKTTKTHSNVYNTFSSHKQSHQNNNDNSHSIQQQHQHPIHTPPLTSTFTSASTTLPTLDASPFLDPTLYIKKSTSLRNGITTNIRNTNNNTTNATHASTNTNNTTQMNGRGGGSISGSDGLKRLHRGKHLVMELFQQQQQQQDAYSPSQRTTTSTTTTTTTHRINKEEPERIHGSTSTTTTHQSYTTSNESNQQKSFTSNQQPPFLDKFCLVGHGVPKQLLQDHVDMAWLILHSCTISIKNDNRNNNDNGGGGVSNNSSTKVVTGSVQESDVVECMFQPFMSTRNNNASSRDENGNEGHVPSGNGLGFDWYVGLLLIS